LPQKLPKMWPVIAQTQSGSAGSRGYVDNNSTPTIASNFL
jgi:hypothetical protein